MLNWHYAGTMCIHKPGSCTVDKSRVIPINEHDVVTHLDSGQGVRLYPDGRRERVLGVSFSRCIYGLPRVLSRAEVLRGGKLRDSWAGMKRAGGREKQPCSPNA